MKIDDEDKTLKLIFSLLPSEHKMPIFMYKKNTLDFVEATNKLFLEERRLNSEGRISQEDSILVASKWKKKKKEFVQKKHCSECRQLDT